MKRINLVTEHVLCFTSIQDWERFWLLCESHSTLCNFRGEPRNWACFAKNEKYSYKPNFDELTISISKR